MYLNNSEPARDLKQLVTLLLKCKYEILSAESQGAISWPPVNIRSTLPH